jgi:hypothetical protein
MSTSIGPPIQHAPAPSPLPDMTTAQLTPHTSSTESMPHPPLYSQSQTVVSPVSLYTQPVSLYSQPQNTVPPVTFYSQSVSPIPMYTQTQTTTTSLYSSFSISSTSSATNSTDHPTASNTGVMIPSHYFYQDAGVS